MCPEQTVTHVSERSQRFGADAGRASNRLRAPSPPAAPPYAPVTRQITSPTSSATSSAPSGPMVTPTGRP